MKNVYRCNIHGNVFDSLNFTDIDVLNGKSGYMQSICPKCFENMLKRNGVREAKLIDIIPDDKEKQND